MTIKLAKPNIEMEDEYNDYISEWSAFGGKIVPYASRPLDRDYKTFIEDTYRFESEESSPPIGVPSTTYFLIDKKRRILGAANIRHYLNDYLLEYGGHIGYGIRPSERKKGYATKMLALSIKIIKELGVHKALVTCNRDNIASEKVIIKNGGIMENEVLIKGEYTKRYWIKLSD